MRSGKSCDGMYDLSLLLEEGQWVDVIIGEEKIVAIMGEMAE